jgi:hypothetical protein
VSNEAAATVAGDGGGRLARARAHCSSGHGIAEALERAHGIHIAAQYSKQVYVVVPLLCVRW